MRVLGIETSCDETAAAVVEREPSGNGRILSNVIFSQIEAHAAFGGVVPEIAARAHVEKIDTIIRAAMDQADLEFTELDAIAATAGPGLVGGLIVGLMTGKAIAAAAGKPFLAVNHLEAHALTARLTDNLDFPYLLLLVSGGHSQILLVKDVGAYERLGTTIDDALGEAFDKTAKLLGLDYPGGPEVEKWAARGDPKRFDLPRPLLDRPDFDLSFAGLKTAVRVAAERIAPLRDDDVADICAGFQAAICDVIGAKVSAALALATGRGDKALPLVAAGGVAANAALRARLRSVADQHGVPLVIPAPDLCADNAAMVAWAGAERWARGDRDSLDIGPRARWPLEDRHDPVAGGEHHEAAV